MITDKDIQKLKGAFATAESTTNIEKKVDTLTTKHIDMAKKIDALTTDHVHLEEKVDNLAETGDSIQSDMRTVKTMVSQLPTREEISTLLNLSQKLDRVREVIREKLHVEV